MCTASTAKRRRRQLAMDKRYRKRSPEASAKAAARAKLQAAISRKPKG